jgi:hypothetical protein
VSSKLKVTIDIRAAWGVVAVAVVAALLLVIFALGGSATRALWRENGIVENLSALFYVAGFLLCAYAAFKVAPPGRFYLLIWSLLCLVFFGEETSWLQQQIGYGTPEWMAQSNVQGEFNLHNLAPLQGGAITKEGFSWRMLLKSQHLFQLGFVGYFLVLPLLMLVAPARRMGARLQVPYPGRNLTFSIWAAVAISAALTLLSDDTTKSGIAETREMIYALSIFAFVATYAWQARGAFGQRAGD